MEVQGRQKYQAVTMMWLQKLVFVMGIGGVHLQLEKIQNPGVIFTCFKEKCNSVSLKQLKSTLDKTLVSSDIMSQVEAVFTESLMGTSDDETSVYTDNNKLIEQIANPNNTQSNTNIQYLMSTTFFDVVTEETIRSSGRKGITTRKTNIAPSFRHNISFNIIVASALCIIFSVL